MSVLSSLNDSINYNRSRSSMPDGGRREEGGGRREEGGGRREEGEKEEKEEGRDRHG